ncbi:MAG: hypothetical protein HUU48_00595 [Flavobacteriales bacterium]|nr:hypothetical protein [Flavobacteriales bacterium]
MKRPLFILFPEIHSSEINALAEKYKCSEIINFTNNAKGQQYFISSLQAHQIENIEQITQQTILEYTQFVAAFSQTILWNNKTIRHLKINKLPVYWLTPFSVKHPYNHWAYNVFLLKNYLSFHSQTNKKYFVALPNKLKYIAPFINELLKMYSFEIVFSINEKQKKYEQNIFHFLKNHLKNSWSIWQIKPNKEIENKNKKVLFFSTPKAFSFIKKAEQITQPYFLDAGLHTKNLCYLDWTKSKTVPPDFYKAKPTLLQLLQIMLSSFCIKYELKKFRCTVEVNEVMFNTKIILKEIENLLQEKSHYLYSYQWLINYFKQTTHLKAVFYEDEFYIFGRIISAARKQSDATHFNCYGIQHGMFSDFHTVYNISDNEIKPDVLNKDNGLPLPDFFITWGNYFTSHFLKHNSLPQGFIKELGNPIYIYYNLKNKTPENSNNKNKFVFLYCLTSEILFEKELPIVNNILQKYPGATLIVRCHPNFVFNIPTHSFHSSATIINSVNASLIDDFKLSDVILTSAHSTVFLDALAYNKKVIRLKTNITDSSMNYQSTDCLTINANSEIPFLENKPEETTSENPFLQKENIWWTRFINEMKSHA